MFREYIVDSILGHFGIRILVFWACERLFSSLALAHATRGLVETGLQTSLRASDMLGGPILLIFAAWRVSFFGGDRF